MQEEKTSMSKRSKETKVTGTKSETKKSVKPETLCVPELDLKVGPGYFELCMIANERPGTHFFVAMRKETNMPLLFRFADNDAFINEYYGRIKRGFGLIALFSVDGENYQVEYKNRISKTALTKLGEQAVTHSAIALSNANKRKS
jgi:hypothetical protein